MAFKLGQLLIEANLITQKQLEYGLRAQRTYGGKLGTNLVEQGFLSDTVLAHFLSQQLRMQAAAPEEFAVISKEALASIPVDFAARHKVIPLKIDKRLRVAICDPAVLQELNAIGFKVGKGIQVVIAPEIWIVAALERYYGVMRETRYIAIDPIDLSTEFNVIQEATVFDINAVAGRGQEDTRLTFQNYVKKLTQVESVKDVFMLLFDYLSGVATRMAIYGLRSGKIQGLMLHGFAVHNRLFSELKLDYEASGFLKPICEAKKPFIGILPTPNPDRLLFEPLGLPDTCRFGFFPIYFENKAVALLMVVPENPVDKIRDEKSRIIQNATLKAGLAMEYISSRKKLTALH
ncbi:MAG: hypothetical protein KDD48_05425 [Bdellovibrionales bacterium]|nr:hypothetical protein [Bdellovibrionales bacterium]